MEVNSLKNTVQVIFNIVETFTTEPDDLSCHTIHYGFPLTPKEIGTI